MVHQLAVTYPQWSPCKISHAYFSCILSYCSGAVSQREQRVTRSLHPQTTAASSQWPIQGTSGGVLEMCRYLGPYASNQPVLVWKLVRLGKFLLSEVGIYGVEVPLERGEVGIRFTWGFLWPYRPYAMSSSICKCWSPEHLPRLVHSEISACMWADKCIYIYSYCLQARVLWAFDIICIRSVVVHQLCSWC